MLALVDFFKFDIDGTDLESLSNYLSFPYARHSRLGNFDTFQDVGKYEEDYTLRGTLYCKSQQELKDFEFLGKMKTKHILTLPDGVCKTILIMGMRTDKSTFLKTGEFLRQDYDISLSVVGGGFNTDLTNITSALIEAIL